MGVTGEVGGLARAVCDFPRKVIGVGGKGGEGFPCAGSGFLTNCFEVDLIGGVDTLGFSAYGVDGAGGVTERIVGELGNLGGAGVTAEIVDGTSNFGDEGWAVGECRIGLTLVIVIDASLEWGFFGFENGFDALEVFGVKPLIDMSFGVVGGWVIVEGTHGFGVPMEGVAVLADTFAISQTCGDNSVQHATRPVFARAGQKVVLG